MVSAFIVRVQDCYWPLNASDERLCSFDVPDREECTSAGTGRRRRRRRRRKRRKLREKRIKLGRLRWGAGGLCVDNHNRNNKQQTKEGRKESTAAPFIHSTIQSVSQPDNKRLACLCTLRPASSWESSFRTSTISRPRRTRSERAVCVSTNKWLIGYVWLARRRRRGGAASFFFCIDGDGL